MMFIGVKNILCVKQIFDWF